MGRCGCVQSPSHLNTPHLHPQPPSQRVFSEPYSPPQPWGGCMVLGRAVFHSFCIFWFLHLLVSVSSGFCSGSFCIIFLLFAFSFHPLSPFFFSFAFTPLFFPFPPLLPFLPFFAPFSPLFFPLSLFPSRSLPANHRTEHPVPVPALRSAPIGGAPQCHLRTIHAARLRDPRRAPRHPQLSPFPHRFGLPLIPAPTDRRRRSAATRRGTARR